MHLKKKSYELFEKNTIFNCLMYLINKNLILLNSFLH